MVRKQFLSALMALAMLFLWGCAPESAPPTQEPTVPTTTAATEPPQESYAPDMYTAAPPMDSPLHSGIREDGTFDSGTLFIGDSLTNGLVYVQLMTYHLVGDARYMAIVGATPQAFFNGPALTEEQTCIYSGRFKNKLFCDAVASVGSEVTAVYFMMGSNYSVYTCTNTYMEIVDYLLEQCPNATIYLQTIPYSDSNRVHYDEINWYIMEAYTNYALEGISRVRLIDTKRAIGTNLSTDGVHLSPQGYRLWYEALLDYAAENNIPQ